MSVKRSVIQYDDYGNELSRYDSIKEAQAVYNCTHISSVCRGKRLHDKGYVWRYEYDYPFKGRRPRHKAMHKKNKAVSGKKR